MYRAEILEQLGWVTVQIHTVARICSCYMYTITQYFVQSNLIISRV